MPLRVERRHRDEMLWHVRFEGRSGTALEGCDILLEESTPSQPAPLLAEESVGADTPIHYEECAT